MAEAVLIEPGLVAIIARELHVHVDAVVPGASLSADLNADSLDVICVVVAIEDEYGIEIPDAQTAALYDGTVADVAAAVTKAVACRKVLQHG